MVDNTFEQELMDIVRKLSESQQKDVLRYARSVSSRPKGTPGKEFLARLEKVHIPPEDLQEMKQIIEEGCERIDWGEWNVELFD